jgi:hypothetical protein
VLFTFAKQEVLRPAAATRRKSWFYNDHFKVVFSFLRRCREVLTVASEGDFQTFALPSDRVQRFGGKQRKALNIQKKQGLEKIY